MKRQRSVVLRVCGDHTPICGRKTCDALELLIGQGIKVNISFVVSLLGTYPFLSGSFSCLRS